MATEVIMSLPPVQTAWIIPVVVVVRTPVHTTGIQPERSALYAARKRDILLGGADGVYPSTTLVEIRIDMVGDSVLEHFGSRDERSRGAERVHVSSLHHSCRRDESVACSGLIGSVYIDSETLMGPKRVPSEWLLRKR